MKDFSKFDLCKGSDDDPLQLTPKPQAMKKLSRLETMVMSLLSFLLGIYIVAVAAILLPVIVLIALPTTAPFWIINLIRKKKARIEREVKLASMSETERILTNDIPISWARNYHNRLQ